MAFAGLSSQHANRARQKDFERRVLRYAGPLLQAGLRFTGNLPLAEDLVERTMLRAWYDFDHLERDVNCRVWLFRAMLDLWSQQQPISGGGPRPMNGGSAASGSLPSKGNDEVRNAVSHLRDDLRIVLLLFSVEGFSCPEISEILAIPIDTVISNLAFARGLVKSDIGPQPVLPAAR